MLEIPRGYFALVNHKSLGGKAGKGSVRKGVGVKSFDGRVAKGFEIALGFFGAAALLAEDLAGFNVHLCRDAFNTEPFAYGGYEENGRGRDYNVGLVLSVKIPLIYFVAVFVPEILNRLADVGHMAKKREEYLHNIGPGATAALVAKDGGGCFWNYSHRGGIMSHAETPKMYGGIAGIYSSVKIVNVHKYLKPFI